MSKWIRRVLIVICSVVFIYSAVSLGKYYFEYKEGDSIYEGAREFTINAEIGTETEKAKKQVDFKGLQEINEDIFSWIRIDGTSIDYPVTVGRDNVYYLSYTYDNQRSSFGSIFLDMKNNPDYADDHTIIYGHNMKNKSMFGSLSSFQKQDFFDAHKTITILTPTGSLTYEIFSVYTAHVLDPTYEMAFADEATFQTMLDHMTESSLVSTQKPPVIGDKILTLSTCTPSGSVNNRFVVNAVLVEDTRDQAVLVKNEVTQ